MEEQRRRKTKAHKGYLVALKILDFLDILLYQVVPSPLDDPAFLVVQVLQEILTYPSLEYLGLPLAPFRLFCLYMNE